VAAQVRPDLRGVLLGLVEAHQGRQDWQQALACLERLWQLEPDDTVVKVSIAELMLHLYPGNKEVCRRIIEMAKDTANETPVDTALLLYKGMALRMSGLPTAARDTLTAALRRTAGRREGLLRAIRYERALAYEDLGQQARARAEFERLYAEDPGHEDVAARLGLA
jgi:tetratricopeptide (TPR) repeat protein